MIIEEKYFNIDTNGYPSANFEAPYGSLHRSPQKAHPEGEAADSEPEPGQKQLFNCLQRGIPLFLHTQSVSGFY